MKDPILSRDQAAAWLKSLGLRTTTASLATMANRGGGPAFLKIGRYVYYRPEDLQAWVGMRCSGLVDSTSDEHGREISGLFQGDLHASDEIDDSYLDTGQSAFDEVTKLLEEERQINEGIRAARAKYDQQFVPIEQ